MSYDVLFSKTTRQTGSRTRMVRDRDTGLPLIVREQNTTPIVDDNKRQQTRFDRHELRAMNTKQGVMVANIPNVVWWQLWRSGIARNPRLLRQWLNRRDAQFFRTDDGRRL